MLILIPLSRRPEWVPLDPATHSPVMVDETRIFNPLFKSDDPAGLDNFLDDINPDSLEIVTGAMVESSFFGFAKKTMKDARKASEERTKKALEDAKGTSTSPSSSATEDDTPKATVDQLLGKENIRFQGLRVAYFTVDKDSTIASLDEGEDVLPARREGDKIILNRIVSLKEDLGKKA